MPLFISRTVDGLKIALCSIPNGARSSAVFDFNFLRGKLQA
jgi:hypothetical protein